MFWFLRKQTIKKTRTVETTKIIDIYMTDRTEVMAAQIHKAIIIRIRSTRFVFPP